MVSKSDASRKRVRTFSLGATSTNGHSAILAVIVWWWAHDKGVEVMVDDWLRGQASDVFSVKAANRYAPSVMTTDFIKNIPFELGTKFLELSGGPFLDSFWKDVSENPSMRFAMEEVIGGSDNVMSQVEFALREVMAPCVGTLIKESPEFERFMKDMAANRKRMKTVRKVMES